MVVEILRQWEREPWVVRLNVSTWRPERRWVTVERERLDEDGDAYTDECCLGFADDRVEADRLFEVVQRALELVLTGDTVEVDWAELPPGVVLD